MSMRGSMGSSPSAAETRLRSYNSIDEICKRRSKRGKVKEMEKPQRTRCRFRVLKVVLLIVISGTLVSLLHSPEITTHLSNSRSRWMWGGSGHRYVSDEDIDWRDVVEILENLNEEKRDYHGVGFLNFNDGEINQWKQLFPGKEHSVLHVEKAQKTVNWESLFPEWIDEEEEAEVPVCPSLPKVKVAGKPLDLVVVKLPCRTEGNWSRDVARLHLQLAAGGVAATAKGNYPVYLLFITRCFPIPNLFRCEDLVVRKGDSWLYKPNLHLLREKLKFPVGSCELALPLSGKEVVYGGNHHREAYATILHSAHVYVCGAIVAAQSIRMSGSTRDLVILVDETISWYHRSGLEAAGWKIRTIERIRNPKAEKDAYNEWNYSKFRLWQLTDYDKIIFIDADLLILRNIDFLFQMNEISATGNNGTLFNSGVMLVEPSNCTFKLLMDNINEFESYNGGDQGYLNEVFTWWHRIPKHMNFLKNFWIGDDEETKERKTQLFGADPSVLYVLHYLGLKPWLCYRDYDCNWNVNILQEFASDVAHERWWKMHDKMPEELQQFCLLKSKQKAQLEWDRREAEKANFTDGHWRIKIKDPRSKKCIDNLCSWKSMLRHWGETNWTDDELFAPSPPAIRSRNLAAL